MPKNKNRFIIRYNKIIIKLISKSFPLLKNKKIYVYEKESVKESADALKLFFWRRIRVHPRLRNYSKSILMGIFVHELCHLEDFELSSNYSLYFIKKYRKNCEKNTDRRVIEKGYAKELYNNRKFVYIESKNDKKRKKMRPFYLSLDEIKSYAKSISRWD